MRWACWTIITLVLLALSSQEASAQWTPKTEKNMELMGGISTETLLLYGAALTVTVVVLAHVLDTPHKPKTDKPQETGNGEETRQEGDSHDTDVPTLDIPAFHTRAFFDTKRTDLHETRIVPLVGLAMTSRANSNVKSPSMTIGVMVNF